ncbi:MAG: hypothetical protein JWN67_2933 [Actinomycetia bacterium]|nr:hypothetical protein [Actinomycetes bacterium]
MVGWLAAIVFAGGVAQVVAEHQDPKVDTIVRDVHVLPAGQAKVTGTITSLHGTDVIGPPLDAPITLPQGGSATIENDGETIVWTGGRPFALVGPGLDLGPTALAVDADGEHWSIDGPRALLPGHYEVRTSVAVGRGGLATPRDSYAFDAGDDAVLDAPSGVVTASRALLHLTGSGRLVLDGTFEVRTREGRRTATHLEFGPGPLDVDLAADGTITATLQGPLR